MTEMMTSPDPQTVADEMARRAVRAVQDAVGATLFGLEDTVEHLLIAVLAGGHVLLEDVPGVGKTALAKAFANLLGLEFRRVQCTPDMLPTDVLGGLVFNPKTGDFQLRKGPVFSNILLVDEINRALPRTQSALLEAMAERQVTIDGETHPLPEPFLVIATQNPIESQGVFPLPEAQLDRFLMKTSLGYPDERQELLLLRAHLQEATTAAVPMAAGMGHVLESLTHAYRQVQTSDELLVYIARIVRATRERSDVLTGASPRAMVMLTDAARAAAALAGRSYLTPDDVQKVAPSVLYHRLVLEGYLDDDRKSAREWVMSLLQSVSVPVDRPQP
ncbi:MAG: AAA family ATPase [Bacilli bacterium]